MRMLMIATLFIVAMPLHNAEQSVAVTLSPESVIMTFSYDTTSHGLDTLHVDPDDPLSSVLSSYRVDPDDTVWVLTAIRGDQRLRHFESVSGQASEIEEIRLPLGYGFYSDFVIRNDTIFLSRLFGSVEAQALFYEVQDDSIVREVILPPAADFNRGASTVTASIGRLQVIQGTVFNVGLAYDNSLRIADDMLLPTLTDAHVSRGTPTATSGVIWQNTLKIMRDDSEILTLRKRTRSGLRAVFPNGSFLILRQDVHTTDTGTPCRLYEQYSSAGELLRTIVTRTPYGARYGIIEGRNYYYTSEAVYLLRFAETEAILYKY